MYMKCTSGVNLHVQTVSCITFIIDFPSSPHFLKDDITYFGPSWVCDDLCWSEGKGLPLVPGVDGLYRPVRRLLWSTRWVSLHPQISRGEPLGQNLHATWYLCLSNFHYERCFHVKANTTWYFNWVISVHHHSQKLASLQKQTSAKVIRITRIHHNKKLEIKTSYPQNSTWKIQVH